MRNWSRCILLLLSAILICQIKNAASLSRGACYSAMHNPEYSSRGTRTASRGLDLAIEEDFRQMAKYFSHVRTFYSNFSGYTVIESAYRNKVKLHLGVFMTNESWYRHQLSAAVDAMVKHPESVQAILVGNENLWPNGPYTADQIIAKINEIKASVKLATGLEVKVGTVQRYTEWMNSSLDSETLKLAASCEIIGVNIYPLYSSSYKRSNAIKLLDSQWRNMITKYGADKVRLTETGWPSGGTDLPRSGNIPSLDEATNYYEAFTKWTPVEGNGPAFWYSFYDRRPEDTSVSEDYKKHFGFFTYLRQSKADNYPYVSL